MACEWVADGTECWSDPWCTPNVCGVNNQSGKEYWHVYRREVNSCTGETRCYYIRTDAEVFWCC